MFEALAVLGLDHSATLPEIKARYRALSLQHHPDHGGDQREFERVCDAYRQALAWVYRAPCIDCDGKGWVRSQVVSFDAPRLRCSACGGKGVRT